MLAAAAIAATPTVLFGQTVASWLLPVNGSWEDAGKWSSAPFVPNNGNPAGTTYAVDVTAVGSLYAIYLNLPPTAAPYTLDSLRVNSPDVAVQMFGGTLSLTNGLHLRAGRFDMYGGSVSGHIVGEGGTFLSASGGGTFDGVTIEGTIPSALPSGGVTAVNGLTLKDGAVFSINSVIFNGTQHLSGSGTVNAFVGCSAGG